MLVMSTPSHNLPLSLSLFSLTLHLHSDLALRLHITYSEEMELCEAYIGPVD